MVSPVTASGPSQAVPPPDEMREADKANKANLPETAPVSAATPPTGAELRIVEWQNEIIVRGAHPYTFHTPDPVLRELRERYRLDEVVANGRTEFEQFVLLREWVHTRWRHGWNTPPNRNALELLRAAEAGSEFACGYFATTMVQCLLALGFVARLVSIAKAATEWMAWDEGNIGHAVMEVWSHQFHKWVVLDADLNVHYERNGIPLSALEIHRAWISKRWDEVRMVQGPTPFRLTDRQSAGFCVDRNVDDHWASIWTFTRHHVGDFFQYLMMPLRNTQHLHEAPTPTLEWIDESSPPRLVRYGVPSEDGVVLWTTSEADFQWTVDQVHIGLRVDPAAWGNGQAVLRVTLDHSTPNLGNLLVRTHTEPWRETSPSFTWTLHPGKNQIMAKAVNAFGREGHISRVLLRYFPGT